MARLGVYLAAAAVQAVHPRAGLRRGLAAMVQEGSAEFGRSKPGQKTVRRAILAAPDP